MRASCEQYPRDFSEQKVKDGVEVKLLYDDIGCMATWQELYQAFAKDGIDAHKFNKVDSRLTVAYNRDHRRVSGH